MRENQDSMDSHSSVRAFHIRPARPNGTYFVRSIASGVFLIALAVGMSSSSMRADDTSAPLTKQQIKELIKTAKTPEDHMKLAHYYQYEADKFKAEAQEHQEMSAEYTGRPYPKSLPMSEHCNDLSGYLTRAEKKAEELASMHEEMAKNAEK